MAEEPREQELLVSDRTSTFENTIEGKLLCSALIPGSDGISTFENGNEGKLPTTEPIGVNDEGSCSEDASRIMDGLRAEYVYSSISEDIQTKSGTNSEKSLVLQEDKHQVEPVTVVIDPLVGEKDFIMELNKRRIDEENSIMAPEPLWLNRNEEYHIRHPSSLFIYPERNNLCNISCMPSRRGCSLCLLAYIAFFTYLISGLVLFNFLEGELEASQIVSISTLKNDTAVLLATELRQVSPYEPVWAQYVFKHLDIFEENLLRAGGGREYWRRAREGGPQRWSKRSSLFYSLALMTRTGYCSMSPKSEWGRTATVCYSLFAIPVTLFWFVITGRFLSNLWSRTLDIFCCYMCIHFGRKENSKQKNKIIKGIHTRSNSILPIEQMVDPPTLENTPKSQRKYHKPPTLEITFNPKMKFFGDQPVFFADSRSLNNASIDHKLISMDHAVCIVFAVLLFVVYFVIGSALLAIREDLLVTDSFYFNFLMLMTIGPECSDHEDNVSEVKISNDQCHIYFLYGGYSILSMVFYLIFTFYFPNCESYWSRKRQKMELVNMHNWSATNH